MSIEELINYAGKLSEKDIQDIRTKIYKMNSYDSGVRLTIKRMAAYLIRAHPELYVKLEETSGVYKDTTSRGSRLRTPGKVEYTGYILKVWKKQSDAKNMRSPNLINHDTTETYRYNAEVAEKIVSYEKTAKPTSQKETSYRIKEDGKWYYYYAQYKTKKALDNIKVDIKTSFNSHYQKKFNSKGSTMKLITDMVTYGKNISVRSFEQSDGTYTLYCNYEKQFVDRW